MLTGSQSHVIRVLVTSTSSISFISSVVVVVCFLLFGDLRKGTGNQLVFCMLIADMGSSFAIALTPFNTFNDSICLFQAFVIQFFDVSAFIWTSFVAINAWLVTMKQYNLQNPILVICHALGWALPFVLSLYNYLFDNFGQQDPAFHSWCWIQDQHVTARMVTYYGPLIILWSVTVVLYLALLFRFQRSHTSENHQSHRKAKRMILSFLAVFIGCKVFALVNRMQNAFDSSNPIFILIVLQAATDPLRGFMDCVVYTFAKVRSRVRERLLQSTHNLQATSQKYKYSSI